VHRLASFYAPTQLHRQSNSRRAMLMPLSRQKRRPAVGRL